MRTSFFLLFLVLVFNNVLAQDTLYKADGAERLAKIIEVNDTQIKYKLFSNPEGPTYVISKENVSRIIYEGGLTEEFAGSAPDIVNPVITIDPRVDDFGRNFISVNLFDLILGNLTFGYEYTFKSGRFGLKVPASFGIGNKGYDIDKVFGTGLDINMYPYGQGSSKFFYGPSFEYKKFKTNGGVTEINSAYAFLFQAGFLFQPQKHFNISVNAGIGYARLIREDYYYENKGDVATRLGLNIGYKF